MANRKLLMVLGPVEIENDILEIGSLPQEYNRTPAFTQILSEIHKNLQYLFSTQNPVFVLGSSGTGAMECAVTNVLSRGDAALYINGGTFGERWGAICKQHNLNTIEIKLDYGVSVKPEQIKEHLDKNNSIKAVFITQNETSTGILTDVEAIAKIVKNYPNTILIVDCISSILVEPIEMDKWGVDVVVSSSQKALAIPPGLGFISFSEKAWKFVEKADLKIFYFDANEYLSNWKRNQTPYTPPISLLFQLDARLKKIKKEGLENVRERYRKNTQLLRNGFLKMGLSFLGDNLANCVTGILTPKGIDASKVVEIMSNKHNISIAPSPANFIYPLFRIGNFGNIGEQEIQRCLNALNLTLEELTK